MRIAVPYENGSIFQHFGRTAAFKLYDAEDGEVRASAVQSTDGSGHGALVGFLRDKGVDALICGGIGGGAQTALACARCSTAGSPMTRTSAAATTTTHTGKNPTPAARMAADMGAKPTPEAANRTALCVQKGKEGNL